LVSRFVDFLLYALLLVFFLPSLAWYLIQAFFGSRHTGLGRSKVFKVDPFRQSVGEFNFEHAIEAYEDLIDDLIDTTFAPEGRP